MNNKKVNEKSSNIIKGFKGLTIIQVIISTAMIEYDYGLTDMGMQTGDAARNVCPEGSDLPVIRSKEVLGRIQAYLGDEGIQVFLSVCICATSF